MLTISDREDSIHYCKRRKYFTYDWMYRPRVISFGIDLGSNFRVNNKIKNVFIEISILFWTFGIEYRW